MVSPSDKKLIDFTEFVATKFVDNLDPWVYTRDLGDLEHIRFKRDYTGYNALYKRILRGFKSVWDRPRSGFLSAWLYFSLNVEKDNHLPDGKINGIFTAWEEDGEYIAMMQPIVGVQVLNFLKNEPDNPHAQAILEAMRTSYNASWSKDND